MLLYSSPSSRPHIVQFFLLISQTFYISYLLPILLNFNIKNHEIKWNFPSVVAAAAVLPFHSRTTAAASNELELLQDRNNPV